MTMADAEIARLPAEGELGIVDIGALTLESGAVIDNVQIAVERWGELSPSRDNVVVVLHALTGDSHVAGPAGPNYPTPGWWDGVVGPDRHQRAGWLPRIDRSGLAASGR